MGFPGKLVRLLVKAAQKKFDGRELQMEFERKEFMTFARHLIVDKLQSKSGFLAVFANEVSWVSCHAHLLMYG